VEQKLSGLQTTDEKETAHGHDPVSVRQVRVEGIAAERPRKES
jgi:hypothetical protein